jgi:protein O-GlcNAc transferase
MTGLVGPTLGASHRLYRAAFVLGVALYLSCFLLGLAYELLRDKRLPAYDMSALSQAQEFLRRGDLPRAVQQYRMAARIDRGNYDTSRRLAEMLKSVGDPSAEIDVAEADRDRLPRLAASHRALGWVYYQNRLFDEADVSFRQALAIDPGDLEAQRGVGEAALERRRLPEAIEAYRQLLGRNQADAAAHNSLAIALMQSGRREEGIQHFEEAARLDPGFATNLQHARQELGAPRP